MRRLLAITGLICLGACSGAPEGGGARIDFGLTMSQAVATDATGFQVVMLANGNTLDCQQIQQTCVRGNPDVPASSLVPLFDSSGQQVNAVFFPNTLSSTPDGGASQTQTVSLSPGKNYALVVEAVGAGPSLLGSSCQYVTELRSGDNGTFLASIAELSPPAACDPRF